MDDPNRLADRSAGRETNGGRQVEPGLLVSDRNLHGVGKEWFWWGVAVVVSVAMIVGSHVLMDARGGIPAGFAALALSGSISLGPIFWRRGSFGINMPVASTLLTISFRMLLLMGALGLVTATKWSHRNSFAGSLLGCYFIFLALESALSIRYYSSRTPS